MSADSEENCVVLEDEDGSVEELPTSTTSSPGSAGQQNHRNSVPNTSEDDDEISPELANFIRIRSHGDAIFADEDEDEEFEFCPPMAEIESPPTRKRKQDFKSRRERDDLPELVEIDDEAESDLNCSFEIDNDGAIYPVRKRDRVPLYLLNPNDFPQNPKKQIQIRRAIITYRHHREKKAQIIRLTEENQQMRELMSSWKSFFLDFYTDCDSDKNRGKNIDILNVEIPVVPPRVYFRGNKTVLAAPYHKYPPPSDVNVKTEIDKGSPTKPAYDLRPPPIHIPAVPKPLIGPSRMQQISSNAISASAANNGTTGHTPIASQSVLNGKRPLGVQAKTNTVQKHVAAAAGELAAGLPGRTQQVSDSQKLQIKLEPGMIMLDPSKIINLDGRILASASMMGFAKSPSLPVRPQTASQMLFASKANSCSTNTINCFTRPISQPFVQKIITLVAGPTNRPAGRLRTVTLPPYVTSKSIQSTLDLLNPPVLNATRPLPSPTANIPSPNSANRPPPPLTKKPIPPLLGVNLQNAVKTQILRMVQTPQEKSRVAAPAKVPRPKRIKSPTYVPILPKPPPGMSWTYETGARYNEANKEGLKQMWSRHDDDDEDEMAIIAAISGSTPVQELNVISPPGPPPPQTRSSTRKQAIGRRTSGGEPRRTPPNSNVLRADGDEIELANYADIVFEEADSGV